MSSDNEEDAAIAEVVNVASPVAALAFPALKTIWEDRYC
jgi:hypothetical protein